MKDLIIPAYDDVFRDIMSHKHTHYVLKGGRGSTKSSFIGGIVIPLLIMQYPNVNAVCFRKVGNTVQNSIYSQVTWGIYTMGLQDLFHIPKTYSNPIIYKPTGQKIFFMGMDDPNKVKSIKVSKGYIGITWWEELDQFAGEAELRKVLQSTMRGGNLFWDFRTFNPPISIDNWANEYAEESLDRENTLVVSNTYLDVPISWLGQPFIDEAEDLKRINPRAYDHEYMGLPVGTGGGVFPNACDLDMQQMVPVYDYAGNVLEYTEMWKTFDKIYNGIDWGFAKDPFRFVRMHFDPKKLDLYIFKEYSTVQTRNQVVYDIIYKEKKLLDEDDLVLPTQQNGNL
jgi:PBSX family phage terminase large subunit